MPIQLYVVIKLCQGIGYACYYFVYGVFWTWRALLALLLTPAGHRRIGAYRDLRACTQLQDECYDVTPDWRSDAIDHINDT